MIRIVEIKLLMLPSNSLLMTSRLITVGQTYPRKHIRGNPRYPVIYIYIYIYIYICCDCSM
jgi:hypothetical protein